MQKDQQTVLVDSHNHLLDYQQTHEVQQILEQAYKIGVVYSATNTTRQTQYEPLLALEKRYPFRPLDNKESTFGIIPFFGIHPCFIQHEINNKDWKTTLQKILAQKQLYGIGQIGLDYRQTTLDNTNKQKQAYFFHQQMQMSFLMNRSVTVHCVRAHGQLLKSFKKYSKIFEEYSRSIHKNEIANLSESEFLLASQYKRNPIIMHSYGGSKQITKSLLKLKPLNIFFSLSLKRSQELCEVIPLDKLLIQTDAPYQNQISLLINQNIVANNMQESALKLLESKNRLSYLRANLGLCVYYGMNRWQFGKALMQNSLRAFRLK